MSPWPATPAPPDPFEPRIATIPADTTLHRVHSNTRTTVEFNSGFGPGGRFHFFGDPSVPVLYAAATREAALAETLLRDRVVGDRRPLLRSTYANAVLAGVSPVRDLQVAQLYGLGLTQLGVQATELTDTPIDNYPRTRLWAEAAHRLGLDGIAWMSKRDNSTQSYMLFGDRVAGTDLEVVLGSGLLFATGPGYDWLVDVCRPLGVDVMAR
ncbi:RES family NAD+ phosphorylase [Kocuria sp. CPCC 205258]|uniref:RES family NAD+ phosphorylase n=1 Tax=Kocuria sp. CPCC 205258 TaxID=3073552 RepID=UPI0034D52279